MNIGARYKIQKECEFTVWAPFRDKVDIRIFRHQAATYPMQKDEKGYWRAQIKKIDSKAKYLYVLDDSLERPDPASFFQPQGVHCPSQVIDQDCFAWRDQNWSNIPLAEMIMYEVHVGTFTPEGTFKAIIPRLNELAELGVNAIELMPVAQFPGERNWGYDGVYPFAVQNSYGGPDELKPLIDACHSIGMAVILDVVYNHLGPEGNYFNDFGPYFTEKYKTPWGKAINFDDAYNDEVRNFFSENALYWFEHFHIDGLRLDAIHAINDDSAKPFLKELNEKVDDWSKKNEKHVYLIAESDLNDIKIIQSPEQGGFGLHAQWSDDFHHAVHTLLTGEQGGYYQDFGSIHHLKKALEESFVYSWDYSPYRKRYHGSCAKDIPADKFVVCLQNHDQVGNRMLGERLSGLASFEGLKVAAGLLFFSPCIPLIFMGEEYAEKAPFNYFISHSDKDLIEAVKSGRKAEFSSFGWKEKFLDPQGEQAFLSSRINWTDRKEGQHKVMLNYCKELIRLRKEMPALKNLIRKNIEVRCCEDQSVLYFRRWDKGDQILVIVSFSQEQQSVDGKLPDGKWTKIIDSLDEKWSGPGFSLEKEIGSYKNITLGPLNFAAYKREQ